MPQVIAIAVLGAGLYAGYRWLTRAGGMLTAELNRAEEELRRRAARASGELVEKDLGALEYDAEAGVYKPRQRA
ncbi:MAG: hypothetical protein AB7K67_10840 [Hyphomicrobiaceae bacterium]|jgi:hypothetical protein